MKRVILAGATLMALIMVAPVLVLVLFTGTSASVAACQQWAGGLSAQITLAQANIKVTLPTAAYRADLDQVLATNPDFVSLNEVSHRTDAQITPAGYGMWRDPNHGADGTAVLWRTDSWVKVASGRVMMVDHGPQEWDHDRAATWATLRGADGGQVSVISVHHMVNPAKYGPNMPLRQQLYRQGLEKVQDLVEGLSTGGPVFLAGDLNYQYSDSADWGPRAMLGEVGMKSSMDVLGSEPTHDGGGIIDYLFFQPAEATPGQQTTENLNSDHRLLRATFALQTPATSSLPVGATGAFEDLTAAQTENAGHVFAVGQQLGVPEKGIVTALAVVSQESGFRVYANDGKGADVAADQQGIEASLKLPHDAVGSDHGSLGIFQQQWPWWSPLMEQLMDPATSAQLFYDALGQVDGWESMSVTQAAQAVQQSAYPTAYADDEPLAQSLYDHFATEDPDEPDSGDPFAQINLTVEEEAECEEMLGLPRDVSCPPTGLAVEQGLSPDALLVLRCVNQQFGPHTYLGVGERAANPNSDHPTGRAVDVMIDDYTSVDAIEEGDAIGEWVRANATELGVSYVIWRARIWNVGDADWSPYSHPSGATDDTSLHMNHLHVSVYGDRGTGFTTDGSTVYPVPAGLADTNQDNWGQVSDIRSSWHTGTDFSVPCGTPVLASHAGTVQIDTTQGWAGPQLVKISVGPGQLTTWYAHMQTVTVTPGDTVTPGQQIGEVGNLGNVSGPTGCHLHFEVHLQGGDIYGPDNTDPTPWLAEHVGSATPPPNGSPTTKNRAQSTS